MSPHRATARTTFADLDRSALDDGVAKLQRILRDVKAFDVKTIKERRDDRLETFQKRVNNLLSDMLGMGSPEYIRHKLKPIDGELDTTFGDHYSMDEYREGVKSGLGKAASGIEAAIDAMKAALSGEAPQAAPAPAPTAAPKPTHAPRHTPAPPPPATPAPTPAPAPTQAPAPKPPPAPIPMKPAAPAPSATASGRVLVLGDGDVGAGAAELLAQLGMEMAVIDSPTIERLDSARDAGYAIVIGTAGGDATMLAIGFLLALVGKQRIALLADEVPAALGGCVHVKPDEDGLWRLLLAREMKKTGLEIDLNRAL